MKNNELKQKNVFTDDDCMKQAIITLQKELVFSSKMDVALQAILLATCLTVFALVLLSNPISIYLVIIYTILTGLIAYNMKRVFLQLKTDKKELEKLEQEYR